MSRPSEDRPGRDPDGRSAAAGSTDGFDFVRLGDLLGKTGLGTERPPDATGGPSGSTGGPSDRTGGPSDRTGVPAPGSCPSPGGAGRDGAAEGLEGRPGERTRSRSRSPVDPAQRPQPGEGAQDYRQARQEVSQADLARRLAEVWPDAVGPSIAANARPVQLRAGRLVVSASSSAWAQSLQLMGEDLRRRLNEDLGTEAIQRVFVRHAGWEAAPPAPAGARRRRSTRAPRSKTIAAAGEGASAEEGQALAPGSRPLKEARAPEGAASAAVSPTEQRAAVESIAQLGLPPELEDAIVRAMRAALVRGEQD